MKRMLYAAGPIGLALLVIGAGWAVLASREYPLVYQLLLGVGALLSAAGIWGYRELLADRSAGKRMRFGAGFVLAAVVGLMIVLLINFAAVRYRARWDMTRKGVFSLHPATVRILDTIENEVEIYAFLPEREARQTRATRDLLDLVAYHQRLVQVTVADPNKRPGLIEELGVRGNNMTVVRAGEKRTFFPGHGEEDLAAALLEVRSDARKVIYWVLGHGERELDTAGGEGFLRWQGDLGKRFFVFRRLALEPGEAIPEDAALVVLADPRETLRPRDVEAYDAYLRRGGRMLMLGDSESLDDDGEHPARELLERWGLRVLPGALVDARESKLQDYPDPLTLVASGFSSHSSVAGLAGKSVLVPGSSPLEFFEVPSDRQIFHLVLLRGSAGSYAEVDPAKVRDVSQLQPRVLRAGEATPPAVLAAFRRFEAEIGSSELGEEARLVVVGDADLFKDEYYDSLENKAFADNLVRWLTGQELLIQRAGEETTARGAMSLEPRQRRMVRFIVVIEALVVFLFGGVFWYFRRSR